MAAPNPHTARPRIIPKMRETTANTSFFGSSCFAKPANNPYAPISKAMTKACGYSGGIETNRLRRIGVTNPTNRPYLGPRINPVIKAGICMSKNTEPNAGFEAVKNGNTTPKAIIKLDNTRGNNGLFCMLYSLSICDI